MVGDARLGGGGFGDKFAQGLGRIAQQAVADRLLAVDEPPDRPLVYPKTPGCGGAAAEQLYTEGEVVLSIINAGFIGRVRAEAIP